MLAHRIFNFQVFFVTVTPELRLPHAGFGQVVLVTEVEVHQSGPDVGTADIDRDDGVVPLDHPWWQEVGRADQTGFVRMVVQLDRNVHSSFPQQNSDPRNGKFSDPSGAEAYAEHDALGGVPGLIAQEPPDHAQQLLRELLDGALQDSRAVPFWPGGHQVSSCLSRRWPRYQADPHLPSAEHPSLVKHSPKCPFAGFVADEAVFVLDLEITTVDFDSRQRLAPWAGEGRGAVALCRSGDVFLLTSEPTPQRTLRSAQDSGYGIVPCCGFGGRTMNSEQLTFRPGSAYLSPIANDDSDPAAVDPQNHWCAPRWKLSGQPSVPPTGSGMTAP
jgi:hypothetical protein